MIYEIIIIIIIIVVVVVIVVVIRLVSLKKHARHVGLNKVRQIRKFF